MSGGVTSSLYNGLVPVMAVVSRGADKIIQVMAVAAADVGSVAGTYLGPSGPTTDINQATPIEGPAGADGAVSAVNLGNATIAENNITTLSLGVRRVNVAVAGATVGGNFAVFPTGALGAGYGIVDAICTVAGTITFGILVPVLTIGSYSIGVRVVKVL